MRAIILWFSRHTLVLFALLILIAIFFWLMKFQKKLKLYWKEALLVALGHVVIGWSCMRLLALIEVGFDLEKAANMRLYGAIFVLPLLYYAWAKLTKRDTALVMDIAAICVIFGAISGRMNCFTNGCCIGYPMFGLGSVRWPLRELEMLYYLVFIGIYGRKTLKKQTCGQVYPIYLMTYGTLRFLSEFVREEYTGGIGIFHLAHIWSLIAIVIGAGIYYKLAKDRKSGESRKQVKRQLNDKKEEKAI